MEINVENIQYATKVDCEHSDTCPHVAGIGSGSIIVRREFDDDNGSRVAEYLDDCDKPKIVPVKCLAKQ